MVGARHCIARVCQRQRRLVFNSHCIDYNMISCASNWNKKSRLVNTKIMGHIYDRKIEEDHEKSIPEVWTYYT